MTLWILLFIIALGISLFLVTPLIEGKFKPLKITSFMAAFIAGGLGLYAYLGTPVPPERVEPNDMAAMMTEADIQAMVDGLAARLAEDPEDPSGWVRLIRSRIVLNDIPQLIEDHKAMSAHFAERPRMIVDINELSGFDRLTESLLEQTQGTHSPEDSE